LGVEDGALIGELSAAIIHIVLSSKSFSLASTLHFQPSAALYIISISLPISRIAVYLILFAF
jgi:hypothetical protein